MENQNQNLKPNKNNNWVSCWAIKVARMKKNQRKWISCAAITALHDPESLNQ